MFFWSGFALGIGEGRGGQLLFCFLLASQVKQDLAAHVVHVGAGGVELAGRIDFSQAAEYLSWR